LAGLDKACGGGGHHPPAPPPPPPTSPPPAAFATAVLDCAGGGGGGRTNRGSEEKAKPANGLGGSRGGFVRSGLADKRVTAKTKVGLRLKVLGWRITIALKILRLGFRGMILERGAKKNSMVEPWRQGNWDAVRGACFVFRLRFGILGCAARSSLAIVQDPRVRMGEARVFHHIDSFGDRSRSIEGWQSGNGFWKSGLRQTGGGVAPGGRVAPPHPTHTPQPPTHTAWGGGRGGRGGRKRGKSFCAALVVIIVSPCSQEIERGSQGMSPSDGLLKGADSS